MAESCSTDTELEKSRQAEKEARSFTTDTQLKKYKGGEKNYRVHDTVCPGLYVVVMPSGRKTFRYDFRFQGGRQTLTLGTYGVISIADARQACLEAKAEISKGINPALAKQLRKQEQKKAADDLRQEKEDQGNTFGKVATEWLELKESNVRPGSFIRIRSLVVKHMMPTLETMPIKQITQENILSLLNSLGEYSYNSLSNRVCMYIKLIFKYAITKTYIEKDPTLLIETLLKGGNNNEKRHFPAITEPDQVADMLQKIRSYIQRKHGEVSPYIIAAMECLQYMPLRQMELLALEWAEVDLEAKKIMIPASRMKNHKDFTLYLSKQAVAILRRLETLKTNRYVFASVQKSGVPISSVGIRTNFGSAKVPTSEQSLHGWRSTFSSICRTAGAPRELSERCLSHNTDNQVEQAYNRSTYELPCRRLMQWYADCMDSLAEGKGMLDLDVGNLYSKEQ